MRAAVGGVALSVEHETRYDYGAPVDLAQHMAYLRPIEDEHQAVDGFEMGVEPEPQHHDSGLDRYGNHRTFFTVSGAHRYLSVRARSRVRVLPRRHAGDAADTLAWEDARQRLRYAARADYEPAAEFCVPSPYVPRLAALRSLAEGAFAPGRPVGLAAIELMHRIHDGFRYQSLSTSIDTPLADVLEHRRGVCQDFAHLMIGACRMHGLAARYVSGYLLTTPAAGAKGEAPADAVPAFRGADASHAWVAVWCPLTDGGAFWLELDPTNDVLPATGHVRLAHGRDYGDVTPLRGVIRGGGDHALNVWVHTRRID